MKRRGLMSWLAFGLLIPAAALGQQPSPPNAPERLPESSPVAGNGASRVVDDSDYAIQLRDLEERVNDLKERVFRSKARLILLKETVLNGVISGAKAIIVHRNEMGSSFTLEQASYALDGAPLLNKTSGDGALDDQEEIELFSGSIVPGSHNLSVYLVYRGNGYGVFSYLRGYTFKIKSSHAFTAEEGKVTTLKAIAYERGGFTTDLKDRPAIRYDMEVKQELRPGDRPAADGSVSDGAGQVAGGAPGAPTSEPSGRTESE